MEKIVRFSLFKNAPNDIPEPHPVWPEGTPDREVYADMDYQEYADDRIPEFYERFVWKVSEPMIYDFPASAENNTGKAVIVCPGGGYNGVSMDNEGFNLARFFNAQGISAFVLKYRMPAPNGKYGLLRDAPRMDAARAIRFVRANASSWGIDTRKIGIMGFSSGGHLAVTASTLYDSLPDDTRYPGVSARPDFSILIYPVISLYEGYSHIGSRNNLLGLEPPFELMKRYSGEKNVTPETPPAFLITTEDDIVHPLNSINYFVACQEQGVPAELHVYPEGGHGYGLYVRGLAVDSWPDRLAEWLAAMK